MGEHVSKSTVSRAARTLGTKVEELRKALVEVPIPYLFLDATFVDARWAREVESVSALVAHGIGLDGHRQLLAVTIGAEEELHALYRCGPRVAPEHLRSWLSWASRSFSRSDVRITAAMIVDVARRYPPGTILERRGTRIAARSLQAALFARPRRAVFRN